MQVLIQTPAIYYFAQQGAIFKEEKNGFSMHFANHSISEDNKRLENWYCMNFKSDFIDALKEFKRLPDHSF